MLYLDKIEFILTVATVVTGLVLGSALSVLVFDDLGHHRATDI